jgi:hypothetical protein
MLTLLASGVLFVIAKEVACSFFVNPVEPSSGFARALYQPSGRQSNLQDLIASSNR